MKVYEYSQAKQALLTATNVLAPSNAVQRAFVQLIHRMEIDGEKPKYIIRTAVAALHDGLAYGNWPS